VTILGLRAITIAILAAGVVGTVGPNPATAGAGRLIYKIEVTNPGTKSQGWHGTLYDDKAQSITAKPGEAVETQLGDFVSIECVLPWRPCGMIHVDTIPSLDHTNIILDESSVEYRLYVTAEGTKSEGWHSKLIQGGVAVQTQGERFLSPMGVFLWVDSPHMWGLHGWFPETWGKTKRPAGDGKDKESLLVDQLEEALLSKSNESRPMPPLAPRVRG
jgi:hypothetical protein